MEARRLKAEQRAGGRRSAAEDKEREPERQKELAKQMILEAKVFEGGLYGYQRLPTAANDHRRLPATRTNPNIDFNFRLQPPSQGKGQSRTQA